MPKLRTVQARIAKLKPRVSTGRDAHGHSRAAEPLRRLYSTARWAALREDVFERDLSICQCGCETLIQAKAERICDHIKPHRGDERLFWDPDNLQTLWKPHHDGWKQRLERLGRIADGDTLPSGKSSGVMARPSWFRLSCVPLVVVCGPPGAGKSTFVRTQAAPGDLVICFDEIANRLFGRDGAPRATARLTVGQISDALRERNQMIGRLMRADAPEFWSRAWLILTEPKAEHRSWWAKTLGAEVVVLATPAHECKRRVELDASAGDARGAGTPGFIDEWWSSYRAAPCDRTLASSDA